MTHASSQALSDHFQVLFGPGTCAGLTDGELVDRFRTDRKLGGEQAFETLVTRHGPMVMSVCRGLLDDPSDVHDAFQATFLVLARRAGAIRKKESVGSWLYGVAARVAARGRAASIRRRIRDRRTIEAAGTLAAEGTAARKPSTIERDDGAAIVHQEVDRLPEKYRAPIVLCYLEGLTHDEAAARLRWPVGTVRSRLSRARDRLRSRLTHRGVTAPSALGPIVSWLSGEPIGSTTAATFASIIPAPLSATLARSATHFALGRSATAGSLSAVSVAMAQGVLTTMLIKKLAMIACVALSFGIASVGGGALLVRASRAQDSKGARAATTDQPSKPAAEDNTQKPDEIDPLLQELLKAARTRLETQQRFYEEGRITLDRFIDACAEFEQAELLAAKTDARRQAIRQRHVNLLKEIENREEAEVQVGRGTAGDVAEARQRRLEAELQIKLSEKEVAEKAAILRRLSELERKVDELQGKLGGKPVNTP
jgi:RNA polymerase sigma factor (sigma-70 family)